MYEGAWKNVHSNLFLGQQRHNNLLRKYVVQYFTDLIETGSHEFDNIPANGVHVKGLFHPTGWFGGVIDGQKSSDTSEKELSRFLQRTRMYSNSKTPLPKNEYAIIPGYRDALDGEWIKPYVDKEVKHPDNVPFWRMSRDGIDNLNLVLDPTRLIKEKVFTYEDVDTKMTEVLSLLDEVDYGTIRISFIDRYKVVDDDIYRGYSDFSNDYKAPTSRIVNNPLDKIELQRRLKEGTFLEWVKDKLPSTEIFTYLGTRNFDDFEENLVSDLVALPILLYKPNDHLENAKFDITITAPRTILHTVQEFEDDAGEGWPYSGTSADAGATFEEVVVSVRFKRKTRGEQNSFPNMIVDPAYGQVDAEGKLIDSTLVKYIEDPADLEHANVLVPIFDTSTERYEMVSLIAAELQEANAAIYIQEDTDYGCDAAGFNCKTKAVEQLKQRYAEPWRLIFNNVEDQFDAIFPDWVDKLDVIGTMEGNGFIGSSNVYLRGINYYFKLQEFRTISSWQTKTIIDICLTTDVKKKRLSGWKKLIAFVVLVVGLVVAIYFPLAGLVIAKWAVALMVGMTIAATVLALNLIAKRLGDLGYYEDAQMAGTYATFAQIAGVIISVGMSWESIMTGFNSFTEFASAIPDMDMTGFLTGASTLPYQSIISGAVLDYGQQFAVNYAITGDAGSAANMIDAKSIANAFVSPSLMNLIEVAGSLDVGSQNLNESSPAIPGRQQVIVDGFKLEEHTQAWIQNSSDSYGTLPDPLAATMLAALPSPEATIYDFTYLQ